MEQRSIFESAASAPSVWKLFFDGASRNNPGPSGAGVVVLKDGQPFFKEGCFLGNQTNNQAEYFSLLLGLFLLKPHMSVEDHLLVSGDSELLIKQIKGEYRVKKVHLKPLHALAKNMLGEFAEYQLAHVLRADNAEADEMANQGVDKKKELPQEFVVFLKQNGIPM